MLTVYIVNSKLIYGINPRLTLSADGYAKAGYRLRIAEAPAARG